jgi:iron complex outermembrane receptor protein
MYAGRLSLLWQPVDRLSIMSKTDVGHLDFGAYPASPYWTQFDNYPYGSATPNPYSSDLFDITANTPMTARDKFVRSIFRVDYEFAGGIKFRSLSSYQKANTTYSTDLDGTDSTFLYPSATPPAIRNWFFFDDVDERQISQEIDLISPDDQRFTWLLGASALWNKYHFKEPYQFVIDVNYPLPASNCVQAVSSSTCCRATNPTRSLAGVRPAGLRHHSRTATRSGWPLHGQPIDQPCRRDPIWHPDPRRADDQVGQFLVQGVTGLGSQPGSTSFTPFVATGFRPGEAQCAGGSGSARSVQAREVTSFETAGRPISLTGHIRTTVSGFYNKYKNFQVIIGYPTFPTFGIELNVEDDTTIYGFEPKPSSFSAPFRSMPHQRAAQLARRVLRDRPASGERAGLRSAHRTRRRHLSCARGPRTKLCAELHFQHRGAIL